jgi:hypothetical protein
VAFRPAPNAGQNATGRLLFDSDCRSRAVLASLGGGLATWPAGGRLLSCGVAGSLLWLRPSCLWGGEEALAFLLSEVSAQPGGVFLAVPVDRVADHAKASQQGEVQQEASREKSNAQEAHEQEEEAPEAVGDGRNAGDVRHAGVKRMSGEAAFPQVVVAVEASGN